MTRKAPTRDAIVQLLQHYADGLTKDEIASELDMHPRAVESCLNHERSKSGSATFRIDNYKPVRGRGGRPQAVYVIGPGPDAERPNLGTVVQERARKTRYRESHRALINARLRAMRGKVEVTNPWEQLLRLSRTSANQNTARKTA